MVKLSVLTGTIVIQENVKEDFIVTYARVSSSENRDNKGFKK
jgi:predicted site-specific integrase-resolvase